MPTKKSPRATKGGRPASAKKAAPPAKNSRGIAESSVPPESRRGEEPFSLDELDQIDDRPAARRAQRKQLKELGLTEEEAKDIS